MSAGPDRSYAVAVLGNCCTHGAGAAAGLRKHPRIKLVGAFENDARRGGELAEAAGCRLARDVREIVEDGQIDIVVVTCNPCDKADMVEQACRAGKHILLNKPMCDSLDNARRIVAAVNAAGIKCVHDIPMVKFAPPFARLASQFQSGRFGKVFGYYHNFGMNFGLDFDIASLWPERLDPPQKSGGGEMTNMGCYAIDYLVTLLGLPRKVEAKWRHEWPAYRDADVEHFGQIMADYGDFYAVLAVGKQQLAGEGRHSSCLSLLTEHENVLIDGPARLVTWNNVPVSFEDYVDGWQAESAVDQLLRCIDTDEEPSSSVAVAALGVEVLMAAYRSILEGGPVALPLADGGNPLADAGPPCGGPPRTGQ